MSDNAKILIENIKEMISTLIDKASYDRTFNAIVTNINSNGTYSVKINNIEYKNIRALSHLSVEINDSVKVTVPQNNYNYMFILGKLR